MTTRRWGRCDGFIGGPKIYVGPTVTPWVYIGPTINRGWGGVSHVQVVVGVLGVLVLGGFQGTDDGPGCPEEGRSPGGEQVTGETGLDWEPGLGVDWGSLPPTHLGGLSWYGGDTAARAARSAADSCRRKVRGWEGARPSESLGDPGIWAMEGDLLSSSGGGVGTPRERREPSGRKVKLSSWGGEKSFGGGPGTP